MASGKYVKQLTALLKDTERRELFSMCIDEIERETYWETRQEMLNRMEIEIDKGTVKEHVKYMLSKPKPGI